MLYGKIRLLKKLIYPIKSQITILRYVIYKIESKIKISVYYKPISIYSLKKVATEDFSIRLMFLGVPNPY